MKKYLSLVFLLVTCTSCMDIIEEIFINKDGSGLYRFTVDMSSMMGIKDMLANIPGNTKDSLLFNRKDLDTIFLYKRYT